MQLQAVPTFEVIDPEVFQKQFYEPQKPVVLKNLAKKNGQHITNGIGAILKTS